MRIVFSFLAAALLPALLMTAWYLQGQFAFFEPNDPYIWVRTRGFLLVSLMVAAAFVIVLGIPAFLLLRRLNAVRWWSTIGTGFVLGALPVAIYIWPIRSAGMSASSNGVQTLINGVPTLAGWLQYISAVSFVGACGAVGAAAFWLVWRNEHQQRVPAGG